MCRIRKKTCNYASCSILMLPTPSTESGSRTGSDVVLREEVDQLQSAYDTVKEELKKIDAAQRARITDLEEENRQILKQAALMENRIQSLESGYEELTRKFEKSLQLLAER